MSTHAAVSMYPQSPGQGSHPFLHSSSFPRWGTSPSQADTCPPPLCSPQGLGAGSWRKAEGTGPEGPRQALKKHSWGERGHCGSNPSGGCWGPSWGPERRNLPPEPSHLGPLPLEVRKHPWVHLALRLPPLPSSPHPAQPPRPAQSLARGTRGPGHQRGPLSPPVAMCPGAGLPCVHPSGPGAAAPVPWAGPASF